MQNILVVIGTRPEAIKLSPIVLELQKHSDKIYVEICITAQHRSLLDDVLINFNITSDHDLDLMSDNQTLEEISSKSLTGISSILKQRSFDWILVQGDTSTALSASLSGFYNRVKVGHIEAGLRTYNKWEPYPEEINRQLISKIADLHFAPTLNAKNNLSLEGVEEETIIVTGNTVVDSLAIASDSQPSKHIQNILDTKIASKLARSYSDNHSLKNLIKEFINIDISKHFQNSAPAYVPHCIPNKIFFACAFFLLWTFERCKQS